MTNRKNRKFPAKIVAITVIAAIVLIILFFAFAGRMPPDTLPRLFLISCTGKDSSGNPLNPEANAVKTVPGGKMRMGSCDETEDLIYGNFIDIPQGYVCCKTKTT